MHFVILDFQDRWFPFHCDLQQLIYHSCGCPLGRTYNLYSPPNLSIQRLCGLDTSFGLLPLLSRHPKMNGLPFTLKVLVNPHSGRWLFKISPVFVLRFTSFDHIHQHLGFEKTVIFPDTGLPSPDPSVPSRRSYIDSEELFSHCLLYQQLICGCITLNTLFLRSLPRSRHNAQ